jgi:hypothetical protein
MKIISSISYWITIVARKVLGVTSNSLLAHLKSRSLETQAQAFQFLAEVFSQVVYAVLIFLLINGKRLVTLYGMPQNADILWSLLYSMVLLTFLESLFVLYEKWYIVEEDAHIYLVFNLLSIGILYGSVRSLQSSVVILTTVIGIRVATFILLTGYSFYRWKIWPSYRPHMTTLMIALVIAAIGYLAL